MSISIVILLIGVAVVQFGPEKLPGGLRAILGPRAEQPKYTLLRSRRHGYLVTGPIQQGDSPARELSRDTKHTDTEGAVAVPVIAWAT
jgi:hypothetical protein